VKENGTTALTVFSSLALADTAKKVSTLIPKRVLIINFFIDIVLLRIYFFGRLAVIKYEKRLALFPYKQFFSK